MNRTEWGAICGTLEACWPQRPIRDDAAALWYGDLNDLSAETVNAAVLALYRAGREFMPNGAQIRAEVAGQTVGSLPFREAWNLLLDGIRAKGSHNPAAVVAYIHDRNPVVAVWAAQADIRGVGMSTEGDTTVYAQCRQHYENVMAREQRRITHGGLPSATVPELAPGSTSSQPKPAGAAIGELVASLAPGSDS